MTVTATAQFEIEPDHFPDPVVDQSQPQTRQMRDELNSRIATFREELNHCRHQVAAKTEAVENKRELADGAGGKGEFGAVFIDEYVEQYSELEQLKRELAPQIALAKASIEKLEHQLPNSAPVVAKSSPGRTQITAGLLQTGRKGRTERLARSA